MMSSQDRDRVVVVNGARTPFLRARTDFKGMSAAALGGVALRETIARSDIDPHLVEEIYFGIVSPPAEGTNVGREALFDAGLPARIPCTTVNRYCASAVEAIAGITAKIQAGQIDIGMAGGAESISSIRAIFSQQATDYFQDFGRMKTPQQRLSHLLKMKPGFFAPNAPGIKEPTTGLTMGQSADLMARLFKVSREEQDKYALDSHLKAFNAWERGFYRSHVVPVATPEGAVVEKDNNVRGDTTIEKLSSLRPVFYKDGTITAGNSSPLTDGGSAVLLMRESRARELNLKPLGAIRGYGSAAVDIQKEPLLIGPAFAIPHALRSAGVTWDQIDLIEMHEAFAAQVLATLRAIESREWAREKLGEDKSIGELDLSKLNVNGGSIPLGHPFGATGTRMLLQLLLELRARKKNLGLMSVCAAGGLGMVLVVEAI